MTARIWEECKSWMHSVIAGETHLTADVLWLSDVADELRPGQPFSDGLPRSTPGAP
jgi:hypothetical protein